MTQHYDVLVIGSGPAGMHAATHAALAGRQVAIVERERDLGGACVHRGTIPSKTLRETSLQLSRMRRAVKSFDARLDQSTEVSSLMTQLNDVVDAHVGYMTRQVVRAGVERIHGRARFASAEQVDVRHVDGQVSHISANAIVVAVGSSPRLPPEIPVDHENILDSDSILSMIYLPESLTVLGAGVIASEYASIFAELGVDVTIVDRGDRPCSFMEKHLTDRFVSSFEATGSRYLPNRNIVSVAFDGASHVITKLEGGEEIRSRKLLCALGRVANLRGLNIEAAGIEPTKRGHIPVNEHCQTVVPNIYAVGDVIGFPALAATSMEQGRRAVYHFLGIPPGPASDLSPVGIFTIPEMASIGRSEQSVVDEYGSALTGIARFDEVARGHISGAQDGLLKLVAAPDGHTLLGVHIIGDGACELIATGQMAIIAGQPVTTFVDNIFNWPTLAESYRVAAMDLLGKLGEP